MKDTAKSLFTFPDRCLRFFFLGNVQQNALPVERIPIFVSYEISILLDPNRTPITSYESIFFEKRCSVSMRFLKDFINSSPVGGMYGVEPNIWDCVPFFWCITRQFLDARAHIKSTLELVRGVQEYNSWNLFYKRLILDFGFA